MCASGRNLCVRAAVSTLLVIYFKINCCCFILWNTVSKAGVSEQDILNGKCISCSFQPVISLFLSPAPLHCCCGRLCLSLCSLLLFFIPIFTDYPSTCWVLAVSLLNLRDSVHFCAKEEVEPVVACNHQPGMIPSSSRGLFSVLLAWGFLNFFTKRFFWLLAKTEGPCSVLSTYSQILIQENFQLQGRWDFCGRRKKAMKGNCKAVEITYFSSCWAAAAEIIYCCPTLNGSRCWGFTIHQVLSWKEISCTDFEIFSAALLLFISCKQPCLPLSGRIKQTIWYAGSFVRGKSCSDFVSWRNTSPRKRFYILLFFSPVWSKSQSPPVKLHAQYWAVKIK